MLVQKKIPLILFLLAIVFQLQAQSIIGKARNITREPGKKYTLYALKYEPNNNYQWFKNGDPIQGANGAMYIINALKTTDEGKYHCRITRPGQNTFRQTAPLTLSVGRCQDGANGSFPCDELLVKFVPNVSQGQQNEVRQSFGAKLIDDCRCREFQLWRLPDSLDVEEKGVAVTKELTVDDAGANYFTKKLKFNPDNNNYNPDLSKPLGEDAAKPDELVVALIDTGVDYLHPELSGKIWINPSEKKGINKKDDDRNCLVDDVQGWNFMSDHWQNMDDNGHGTHIAGIIAKNSKSVKIMNLKAFDKDGGGTLFNPICAIYYAADHDVPVLNLSWGYYGEASLPLEKAIAFAGKKGATVIASAGNDTTSHAANQHYPSGYDLDNLITVAALNQAETDLADFSNYGSRKIDLAARGENIRSLAPGGETVMSGSSMAVGFVSSTTINMKSARRNSTTRGIKHSLFSTVDAISDKLTTGGKVNEKKAVKDLLASTKVRATEPEMYLWVYLQGAYDPASGLMRDDLRSSPDFPSTQPFNQAPWDYAGTEHVDAATLSVSGDEAVVDWLLIAYQNPRTGRVTTRAALLRRNGKVTATNGDPLKFGIQYGACHILIMSRNHLALRTKYTMPLDYLPTDVDLRTGHAAYIGGLFGAKKIAGKNFLFAGDINQDGKINNADLAAGLSLATTPNSPSDVNMDGVVDVKDKNITKNNRPRRSNCPRCSKRF